ncbi:unnamed protein product [Bursaphelenchus xylophilus]|uniref:(pine wood nematode) hypothetical protein n=1 Tax=Bursaphelenchus xylophilus TaxID=6326 RepID=A0A1I7SI11_BURXY|nr:unnamed protein product [Bursaphelenchus xylophilus]CAG9095806.1 unnamed protein product [Bursaphelenchus xylophilus]
MGTVEKDETPGQGAEKVVEEDADPQTLPEIVEEINKGGEKLVSSWYDRLMKFPPSVDAFLDAKNNAKNRYPNILLYDRNRVVLTDKLGPDYIHASWVDSYDQPNGYVLAQAPFDQDTEVDFWRMVNQIKPCLIVLCTSTNGADGQKQIKDFWPTSKAERGYYGGDLTVKCTLMEPERDFDNYEMHVKLKKEKTDHKVFMMQYRKWISDNEIPDNLLEFRAMLKISVARAEKEGRGDGPLLFTCPNGCHRSGVMAGLDIVIDRMTVDKKVGLRDTAINLRKQRYGTFHRFESYAHIADIIVRHAVSSGLVNPNFIGVRK